MDVHVHAAVTDALRRRGVDVLTVQEDGWRRRSDAELLDRATSLDRAVVTHDADFLIEAARRQAADIEFGGIIYAHELNITIGQLITQLEFVCQTVDSAYMRNRVEFLPL